MAESFLPPRSSLLSLPSPDDQTELADYFRVLCRCRCAAQLPRPRALALSAATTELRPPPQASVATKNLSGALPGTLPEGGSFTGGHLHHPGALHDEEGVVLPRG